MVSSRARKSAKRPKSAKSEAEIKAEEAKIRVRAERAALDAAEAQRKADSKKARAAEFAKQLEGLSGNKRSAEVVEGEEPVAKRVKHQFNPFLVEMSKYTRPIFQVNNPFVLVQTFATLEDMEEVAPDKITDGQRMDEKALEEAVRLLLQPVAVLRKQYKQARTELGGRIIHAGMWQNLKLLTRPRRSVAEVQGDEQQEDFVLKAGGGYVSQLLDPISDDSDAFATEGCEDFNPVELVKKSRYDFSGLVHDTRMDPQDDLATVLVVKCEWDTLSINQCYQGGGYCMKKARQNMERGRYDPIHVQAWGKSAWRHAVFVPEAIVEVKDGHVVYVSDEQFDPVKLDKVLQQKTKRLQAQCESLTRFPDGKYVKGTYRVCTKELYFPLMMQKGSWEMKEMRLFFQGLLRIFIGDRVLDWKKEDVAAAAEQRLKEIKQDIDVVFETASSTWQSEKAKRRR